MKIPTEIVLDASNIERSICIPFSDISYMKGMIGSSIISEYYKHINLSIANMLISLNTLSYEMYPFTLHIDKDRNIIACTVISISLFEHLDRKLHIIYDMEYKNTLFRNMRCKRYHDMKIMTR